MRICIITIHCIPNFGSVFQTYALCQYLKEIGSDDIFVIDYIPDYFHKKNLRSLIGSLLNYIPYKVRTEKFRLFVESQIPLTKDSFHNISELNKLNGFADIVIAGGDQLWNVYHSCGNDDAYKLTFFNGKKVSYSTSLGQTDFSDKQLHDLSLKISNFSAVSVRERSSVLLLKKYRINAKHCVDPVFLLDRSYYNKFYKPVKYSKYMLVYLVTPSILLERCIKYLSHKHGLKVILCSGFSKKCTCDLFLKDLGPDEILSYIRDAEIVLSSSFHATSFSLIFKKQFFTILPDLHTNERIIDLLKSRNMTDRIITDNSDLNSTLDLKIDYNSLFSYDMMIAQSQKYLKEALT